MLNFLPSGDSVRLTFVLLSYFVPSILTAQPEMPVPNEDASQWHKEVCPIVKSSNDITGVDNILYHIYQNLAFPIRAEHTKCKPEYFKGVEHEQHKVDREHRCISYHYLGTLYRKTHNCL